MMRIYFIFLFQQILGSWTYVYADEIRDIKPPIDFPVNYALWWILAIVSFLAVLGFLLRFFLLGRAQRKDIASASLKSPWQAAYERLDELKKHNLPQQGRVKEYYTQLSDIVRRYIEDRFQIRAPEMTTQEFLSSLGGAAELTDGQKNVLRDFLNSCDLVKFAKHTPTIKEMEEGLFWAQRLVEETKPKGSDESSLVNSSNTPVF